MATISAGRWIVQKETEINSNIMWVVSRILCKWNFTGATDLQTEWPIG